MRVVLLFCAVLFATLANCGGTEQDIADLDNSFSGNKYVTSSFKNGSSDREERLNRSPSIGGYNVYFGMLHNHTSVSDGTGSPAQAYAYARDKAKLDFFSVADHDYYPKDMTDAGWNKIKNAANSTNDDGNFVTFWGFEWTSDSSQWQPNGLAQGHIAVIGSDDYCNSSYEPTRTLDQLVDWLAGTQAIAFFNHPGQYNTKFDKFKFTRTEQIVGMELWNKKSGFTYYYNDGYYNNDGGLGYYDEAIQRGWYLGATGSDDNHEGTWGTRSDYRMAVLATEKTRASIWEAMKARRFYSTADKNLALSFTCNGEQMGSRISGGTLNMVIEASDQDGESFKTVQLLKNGIEIEKWSPNEPNPNLTHTLTANKDDYFYVIVMQTDKDKAISSPIYVTEEGTITENTPPVANDLNVSTRKDKAKQITLSASDADGDALSFAIVSDPKNGTLSGNASDMTYTPNAGYSGDDSFTYQANDGLADSNVASVSITITEDEQANTPPVAANQHVSTEVNTNKSVTLAANDADGDSLSYHIVADPAHGTLSGTPPLVTYEPATDYVGEDSFAFLANDGLDDSNLATVSVTINSVSNNSSGDMGSFFGCATSSATQARYAPLLIILLGLLTLTRRRKNNLLSSR